MTWVIVFGEVLSLILLFFSRISICEINETLITRFSLNSYSFQKKMSARKNYCEIVAQKKEKLVYFSSSIMCYSKPFEAQHWRRSSTSLWKKYGKLFETDWDMELLSDKLCTMHDHLGQIYSDGSNDCRDEIQSEQKNFGWVVDCDWFGLWSGDHGRWYLVVRMVSLMVEAVWNLWVETESLRSLNGQLRLVSW